MGLPGGSVVSRALLTIECNAGDEGLIPGLGRSPGEGNGNPLHYSCLENPMDRGAWQATVHGVANELDKTWRLNNNSNNKMGLFSGLSKKQSGQKNLAYIIRLDKFLVSLFIEKKMLCVYK